MSRRRPPSRGSSADWIPPSTLDASSSLGQAGSAAPGPASTPQLDQRPAPINPQDLFPLLLPQNNSSTGPAHQSSSSRHGLSSETDSTLDVDSSIEEVDAYMLRWGQAILTGSVLSFILGTWSMLVGPLAGKQGIWVSVVLIRAIFSRLIPSLCRYWIP